MTKCPWCKSDLVRKGNGDNLRWSCGTYKQDGNLFQSDKCRISELTAANAKDTEFICAHCGAITGSPALSIDSGTSLTCGVCDKATYVKLATASEYANLYKLKADNARLQAERDMFLDTLKQVHEIPIETDSSGHAFKRVKCRSLLELGAQIGREIREAAKGAP